MRCMFVCAYEMLIIIEKKQAKQEDIAFLVVREETH